MKKIFTIVTVLALFNVAHSQNDKLDRAFNKVEKGLNKGLKEVRRLSKEVRKEVAPIVAQIKEDVEPVVEKIVEEAQRIYKKERSWPAMLPLEFRKQRKVWSMM